MYELTKLGKENIDADNLGILAALEHEPKSLEQLMSEIQLPEETLRQALNAYAAQGMLRRTTEAPAPERIPPPERIRLIGETSAEELNRLNPLR